MKTTGRLGIVKGWLDLVAGIVVVAVGVVWLYQAVRTPSNAAGRRVAPNGAQPARAEPPLPSETISLDNAAVVGAAQARTAIVAFSDFQCPFCRVFQQTAWPDIQSELVATGRTRFAFRHLPLDAIHPQARRIAMAAECSRSQGKFWPFHDGLFQRQSELSGLDLSAFAKEQDLDLAPFALCISASSTATAVQADVDLAQRLGVNGTPTFFVGRIGSDGKVEVRHRLVGSQDVEAFKAAVKESEGKNDE